MGRAIPPPLLVLCGILTTQLGSALATTLFGALGPMGTVFWRLTFAALILVGVARPRVSRLKARDGIAVLAFGAALSVMNLCFYQSLSRLPLGVAVSVEFCGPLAVAMLGSRGLREIATALVAVMGLALLAPWGDIGSVIGDAGAEEAGERALGFLYGLGAGAGWAGYIVLGARASRRVQGLEGLALAMVAGAVLSAPFTWEAALPAIGYPPLLMLALLVALLSSVLPYGFEYTALRHLSPRTFSLILCSEPALAALIGLVLLGDRLGPLAWAGLVCVSLASLTAALGRDARREPAQDAAGDMASDMASDTAGNATSEAPEKAPEQAPRA